MNEMRLDEPDLILDIILQVVYPNPNRIPFPNPHPNR